MISSIACWLGRRRQGGEATRTRFRLKFRSLDIKYLDSGGIILVHTPLGCALQTETVTEFILSICPPQLQPAADKQPLRVHALAKAIDLYAAPVALA